MDTKKSYALSALAFSLFLFALSAIIGLLPLAASVTAYHLEYSQASRFRLASMRLRPWVIGLIIAGYTVILALILYIVLHRTIFFGAE